MKIKADAIFKAIQQYLRENPKAEDLEAIEAVRQSHGFEASSHVCKAARQDLRALGFDIADLKPTITLYTSDYDQYAVESPQGAPVGMPNIEKETSE